MRQSNVIAIDLAKNVFQVCKMTPRGKVLSNKAMSRTKLKAYLIKERPSLVAMESCGGTHYWGRFAKAQGHDVKPMSARRVKAFLQGHKTDANDAEAIALAANQELVKPSRLITLEEQCEQSLMGMREMAVRQKVALAKQLRDQLLELGHPIEPGDASLMQRIPELLEDAENELPGFYREALYRQYEQLKQTMAHADAVDKSFKEQSKKDQACRRLKALEGVGPVCAMMLKIALANPEHFKNGRQASACIGVTPVQHSSGGKERLGSIAKLTGDKKLRSALFEGALAVIRSLDKREARTTKEKWLKALMLRRGKKVSAIALANKTVRTAYAMLKKNTDYQPEPLAG